MFKNGLIAVAGSLLLGFSVIVSANTNSMEPTLISVETPPMACTREYNPVCAEKIVQCITAPCNPVQQTYGNACTAKADGAKVLYEGECRMDSAPMTNQDLVSRAYDKGLTSISNLKDFSFDSKVTREQAAKMIVNAIENSNVVMWTLKLPAGSCEWMDVKSIDTTLLASVNQSCKLGLFKGDRGNFVPYATLTQANLETVLGRAIQFIPSLKEFYNSAVSKDLTSKFVTRGELIKALHAVTNFITNAGGKHSQNQMALDKARTLWNNSSVIQYEFVQSRSCFCPAEYTRAMKYNISGNVITGMVSYQDDGSMVSGDKYEGLMTVESSFDLIQDAIINNVDSLTVQYDPTYGYPTNVSIDTSFQMADEEMYYTFSLVNKTPNQSNLVGSWTLTNYNGLSIDHTGVTLQIDANNRISAHICNFIGANFTLSGQNMMFDAMMSTMMACNDEKITNMESAFNNITTAKYMLTGGTLTLEANLNTWVWTKN